MKWLKRLYEVCFCKLVAPTTVIVEAGSFDAFNDVR
jgi:hypothetical protein